MKNFLRIGIMLACMCFAFAAIANATSCTPSASCVGGISYTWTFLEQDSSSPNVFDVQLVIDTTAPLAATGMLSTFAVNFGGSATNVALESSPGGAWTVVGQGPNTPKGCNINGSSAAWCSMGPTVNVPDGVLTFLFDVTIPILPGTAHVQAFQGQGPLAISNDIPIGGSSGPPLVPEPATLVLFGTMLSAAALLGKRLMNA
jgi:hypothetical protein